MSWVYDDGGRQEAGFKGETGDCVTRAIAIALDLPYREVYREMARLYAIRHEVRTARKGIRRDDYEPWLFDRGWIWNPTMKIGQGTTVHLRSDELPSGPIIVRLTRHIAAVIDGVTHDIYDPSRDGTRCVYGYYQPGLGIG